MPPVEVVRVFFPISRDCTCCHGFVHQCGCCAAQVLAVPSCSRCCANFAPDPEDEELPSGDDTDEIYDYDSPRSPRMQKLIEASAEAVRTDFVLAQTIVPTASDTEAASVSSTVAVDGGLEWSVRVFPPDVTISLQFFREVAVPAIIMALGKNESDLVTWSSRGWHTMDEFMVTM